MHHPVRSIAAAALLLLASLSVPGQAKDVEAVPSVDLQRYTGTWYDAAHSGEGWVVQSISANQYVLLWFSYDDTGHQQWFISIMNLASATIATPNG